MGGKLFSNTTSINKSYVNDTVNDLFYKHLSHLGITKFKYIGSTGKTTVSGDIDICISCSPQNKKTLSLLLCERLGKNNVKISGKNVSIKYPIFGFKNQFVQIDLMLAEKDKLDDIAWLMSGDSEKGIKGVYRNLMLSHMAKKISNKMPKNKKITISFPGGLHHKILINNKWQDESITTDPEKILKILGIKESHQNILTFMKLVDYLIEDNSSCHYLDDFNDYINNYIVSDPLNSRRAIWYIKTKKRLKSEKSIS